ncbi:MAG: prenyltransferase [Anaerolineales bacterium]|jgi:1,4-dihydroxy-2-naphthoate octaprenyltransferase
MPKWKYLLGPMRVPFLIVTLACVLLGVAAAVWTSGRVSPVYIALALVGAVASHISVNALNEYFDFQSGLDSRTTRTPFSGGSGTLPESPGHAHYALVTGSTAFAVTALIGIYFLSVRGLALLPLGLLGLLVILAYTPWLTRNPVFCLVAPGLGFGPLMVMGTSFVLAGAYSWTAFFASLVPFFMVSDLLLLNQFPDVQADKGVGRRHLPIVFGRRTSSFVYSAFLALAYLAVIVGVGLGYLPLPSLIGLGSVLLAVPASLGALRHGEDIPRLIPYMGMNVLISIATPALVAIGLFLG